MLSFFCNAPVMAQDTFSDTTNNAISSNVVGNSSENPSNTPKVSLMNKMNNKGFFMSGSVGFQLGYNYMSGIPQRIKPFLYQITGNVTFRYKDIIELPFSFVFSEQERRFNQPFNQIGVSPKYKWLTLHGGFRNIMWSENSMAGHNMLMVGAEANPSYFRSGILFGRLNRSTVADTSKIDSLSLQSFIPTYKRLGLAVKVGAGTANNYVDLIYFRAWDKSSDSLYHNNDEGVLTYLPKSENAVFNIVTYNKIGKYVTIKADYALSTTNVDRMLPKNKDSVNASYPKIARILMKPNKSAIGGHAANAQINFQKEGWNTDVGFKLLTQDFETFGSYFQQTNTLDVFARQAIPLQKQKGRLNLNMQISDDNLNKKKSYTTIRSILQTGYDYNDIKFGISTQYILVYSKQKGITDSIKSTAFNDYAINQINHTFIVVPRYLIIKGSNTHLLLLNETANFLTDMNKNTQPNTKYFNNVLNLSYTLNIPLKFFSMSTSIFNSYVKNYSITVASYGGSISTNESFAKNKVNISNAVAATYNKLAVVVNGNLNINYLPESHHKLYLTNGITWNKSLLTTVPSFIEYRGTVGYLYTF